MEAGTREMERNLHSSLSAPSIEAAMVVAGSISELSWIWKEEGDAAPSWIGEAADALVSGTEDGCEAAPGVV